MKFYRYSGRRTMIYNLFLCRAVFRYAAVLMRDRFDQTNKEKDMRKLAAMVEEGEEELWRNQHFQPFIFKVLCRKSLQLFCPLKMNITGIKLNLILISIL